MKCVALSLFLLASGCAHLPPVEIQSPTETEQQQRLEKDPAFEELLRQIQFPRDDKLHYRSAVSPIRDRRGKLEGIETWVYVSGTWGPQPVRP